MSFRDIGQPTTYEARCALARKTKHEFRMTSRFLVDDMNDQSRAMFGDLPTPAIIIDPTGRVATKLPWAEPDVLKLRLAKVVARWQGSTEGKRATETADAFTELARALHAVNVADFARARKELGRLLSADTKRSPWFTPLAIRGLARVHRALGEHALAKASLDRAAHLLREGYHEGPRRTAALAEIAALRTR